MFGDLEEPVDSLNLRPMNGKFDLTSNPWREEWNSPEEGNLFITFEASVRNNM